MRTSQSPSTRTRRPPEEHRSRAAALQARCTIPHSQPKAPAPPSHVCRQRSSSGATSLGQQGVQPPLRLWVKQGCLRLVQRVQRHQRAVDAGQRHFPGVHGLARAACGSAARSLQGSGLGLPARLPHAALQRRQAGAAPRLGCGGAHRSRACPAPWRGPGGRPRQRCRRPSGMRHAGPCRHRSACRTGTPCCAGAAADQVHIFRCCLQALPDGDMQQCAPARTARARCRTVQRPQPLTQSCGAAGWLERWSATGAAS